MTSCQFLFAGIMIVNNFLKNIMSKIIGIDLGTTNSCVSVMEGNGFDLKFGACCEMRNTPLNPLSHTLAAHARGDLLPPVTGPCAFGLRV